MTCEHCDDAGRCTHLCEIMWDEDQGATARPAEVHVYDSTSYPPLQLIQPVDEPLREPVKSRSLAFYGIDHVVPGFWFKAKNIDVKIREEKQIMEVGKEYLYYCKAMHNGQNKNFELKVKVLWIGQLHEGEREVAVCLRETLKKKWCIDKFDPFTGQCCSMRKGDLVSLEGTVKDLDWI